MQSDHDWMQQALSLAQKGQYTTRPNPCVGCVIVKNERVVGAGWHQQSGGQHAEVLALADAGENAQGATVYVTLEPCAHQGRTGPCAQALIQAGVARVVVALQDPNPRVNGTGIRQLKAAGIVVETDVCAAEAAALNPGFCTAMRQQKPYVRLKQAMSIDGRVALSNGQSQWITGAAARLDVQYLRARSAAILTGIATVLADDPQLTVRVADWPDHAQPEVEIPAPIRGIVDKDLSVPLSAQVVQTARVVPTWVFCGPHVPSTQRQALEASGVIVKVCELDANGHVFLPMVLDWLYQHDCFDIMIESGGGLAQAAFDAGRIDEWLVYVGNKVLGACARPILPMPEPVNLAAALQPRLIDAIALGDDVRLSYRVYH